MSPNFARVRDWVFDLDNTLYPAASTIYADVEVRMTRYIMRALELDAAAAAALRERYFLRYGATVAGLARHHGVDAGDFLADVHDVALDDLAPDHELNALIARLPGRKIVFTNGGGNYPERVLMRLGLAALMTQVCDIQSAGLAAKPEREAYARLVAQCDLDPFRCVLVEDTPRNLAPAHELGFVTVLVGAAHREPRPAYVDYWARDLKSFLRKIERQYGPPAPRRPARRLPAGAPAVHNRAHDPY